MHRLPIGEHIVAFKPDVVIYTLRILALKRYRQVRIRCYRLVLQSGLCETLFQKSFKHKWLRFVLESINILLKEKFETKVNWTVWVQNSWQMNQQRFRDPQIPAWCGACICHPTAPEAEAGRVKDSLGYIASFGHPEVWNKWFHCQN